MVVFLNPFIFFNPLLLRPYAYQFGPAISPVRPVSPAGGWARYGKLGDKSPARELNGPGYGPWGDLSPLGELNGLDIASRTRFGDTCVAQAFIGVNRINYYTRRVLHL